MANVTKAPGGQASEASVAELLKQLSEHTSRLARQEVELAKAELAVKGKRAGIGAGMFGGAGVFAFCALGALTATAILALATSGTDRDVADPEQRSECSRPGSPVDSRDAEAVGGALATGTSQRTDSVADWAAALTR
jgi:hypothetical protein